MARVWDDADCDGSELLVLLALADYADDDGWCYPSLPAIARKTRMSERHVRSQLRKLEAKGLLFCASTKGGKGKANTYQVRPDGGQTRNPSSGNEGGTNPERRNHGSGYANPANPESRNPSSAFKCLNPELQRPNPEPQFRPTIIEPKIDDGDDAREVPSQPEPFSAEIHRLTPPDPDRERATDLLPQVLAAANVDTRNDISGKWLSSTQRDAVLRWFGLGLEDWEILETVREVSARMQHPPGALKYFDRPMAARAGRKRAEPLKPITQTGASHDQQSADRSPAQRRADDRLRRRAAAWGLGD